jgi:hypothetical protein
VVCGGGDFDSFAFMADYQIGLRLGFRLGLGFVEYEPQRAQRNGTIAF